MIEVKRLGESPAFVFDVQVEHGTRRTRHQVSLRKATFDRLRQPQSKPEEVVEAAFRFLLDREPPESILARFDVDLISRYFPEFEEELRNYLRVRWHEP